MLSHRIFKMFLVILPLILVLGLTQGCSDKASPTEPTVTGTETSQGTGPVYGGNSGTGAVPAPPPASGPDISVDTEGMDFGTFSLNLFSYRTRRVYNVGQMDLWVGVAIFTLTPGDSGWGFSFESIICTKGSTTYAIRPGGYCDYRIRFSPSGRLGCSGTWLHLLTNDPDESEVLIAMYGTAICTDIDIGCPRAARANGDPIPGVQTYGCQAPPAR